MVNFYRAELIRLECLPGNKCRVHKANIEVCPHPVYSVPLGTSIQVYRPAPASQILFSDSLFQAFTVCSLKNALNNPKDSFAAALSAGRFFKLAAAIAVQVSVDAKTGK